MIQKILDTITGKKRFRIISWADGTLYELKGYTKKNNRVILSRKPISFEQAYPDVDYIAKLIQKGDHQEGWNHDGDYY